MKPAKKIALLGFDCALTNLVRKHIAEGIAPNFKKVFENGTVADNCLVPFPTITPPNWTVMATGAWPGTNNVTDFWRHVPGTTPEGANTHSSFNWDYVASESIWEAAETIGKKSIILNYPMSFNAQKKLKHGVVVGGGSLTPGVYMDTQVTSDYKGIERDPAMPQSFTFCEDVLISTDIYANNSVRVKFTDAKDWLNVPDMGDDPLEATYEMPFTNSIFNIGTTYATWHVLVRDMGAGYGVVSLSPSKDFNDAFFTIKLGEWAPAFNAEGVLEKGGTKTIRLKAKLVSMTSEAESFRLYITHGMNLDGEVWCCPPEKASAMNKGDNVSTNNTGMRCMGAGWYDKDTWLEQVGIHYDWLGDTAESLLASGDWDILYSHAHPTDYIYHVLMSDLDPGTCSSPEAHAKAWELHRELYRHADRYLGRLLKMFDDDTLVVLVSDHGATPDGPYVDMRDVLGKVGLTSMQETEEPAWLAALGGINSAMKANFSKLGQRVDTARSKAIPQRSIFVYVNLQGRDPEGCVPPEDYKKVQREIIDALMAYKHPDTGKCPFMLALPKQEAEMLGLWGDQVGDVVFAVWPEYSGQHGPILPTSAYGIGTLRTLCVYYGPELGIRKGFDMQRRCNIVDLVPTFCYLTGWPLPRDVEGSVVYQIMEDPNFRPEPIRAKS